MPIANVTALLQTLPFTVTLGAALLFKAPVGWRRASAIAVGFLGMLLILQPGGDGFSIWSIYALTSVACVTVRDLVTRALSPRVPSFTVAVLGVVSIMAFGGIASIGQEFAPMDTRVVLLIVACAVFSVAAFSFSVFAMRHGDISFTAPFRYSGLLAAAILGYFVFAEVPSWLEALGYVIVVAAGLFTLLREQAVNQKPGKPAA